MTFKHIDFQDSPIMRSLVKVARENGMVVDEPMEKTASSKVDLTPTGNLTQDIITLCLGLRQEGLHKHADKIEKNFITYKKAKKLYETSNGEDLIDAAHPDGSHKMEDLDNAIFQTIMDKHSDIMKMVEKKPTGKFASSKQIINAVKVVLADAQDDENNSEAAREMFVGLVNEVSVLASKIMNNEDLSDFTYHSPINLGNLRDAEEAGTGVATGTTKGHMEVLLANLTALTRKGASKETITELQRNINTLTSLVRDADNIAPVSRAKYTGEARGIYTKLPQVLTVLRGEAATQTQSGTHTLPEQTVVGDPSLEKIKAAQQALNGIAALVDADTNADPADVQKIKVWITRVDGSLKSLETKYSTIPLADINAVLTKLTKDFARVRQEWA